jgi:hypothetical protein
MAGITSILISNFGGAAAIMCVNNTSEAVNITSLVTIAIRNVDQLIEQYFCVQNLRSDENIERYIFCRGHFYQTLSLFEKTAA